jgi:hypothetical protein
MTAMSTTYYWMILYSLPSWIQIIIAQKRKDTNCQKIPDRFQTINRNDECGTSDRVKKSDPTQKKKRDGMQRCWVYQWIQ